MIPILGFLPTCNLSCAIINQSTLYLETIVPSLMVILIMSKLFAVLNMQGVIFLFGMASIYTGLWLFGLVPGYIAILMIGIMSYTQLNGYIASRRNNG